MDKNQPKKDTKKPNYFKKSSKKIEGLDMDKMEYQQIVLSDSNFPGQSFFKKNY